MDDTGPRPGKTSHLFLVRLWLDEEVSEGQGWHGKVQHVVTGKAGGFDSQASMVLLLASMLPSLPPLPSSSSTSANDGRGEQTGAPEQKPQADGVV